MEAPTGDKATSSLANISKSVRKPIFTELTIIKKVQLWSNHMYCQICERFCNSQSQLEEHCESIDHRLKTSLDSGENWQWRDPPNITSLHLCEELVYPFSHFLNNIMSNLLKFLTMKLTCKSLKDYYKCSIPFILGTKLVDVIILHLHLRTIIA